jgi:hypothetical protein
MTTTTTEKRYWCEVVHDPGWSANGHFGEEIARRLSGDGRPRRFADVETARAALATARDDHGGSSPGRFDILAICEEVERDEDGEIVSRREDVTHRFTWE